MNKIEQIKKAIEWLHDGDFEYFDADPRSWFVARMNEALETQLAIERGDGWRQIETAPKDGTWIMAYYGDGNHHSPQVRGGEQVAEGKHNIVIVRYREPAWDGADPSCNETRWESFGSSSSYKNSLTHWQPLPQPPKEGE